MPDGAKSVMRDESRTSTDYDGPTLGSCCNCGVEGPTVRNFIMLDLRSPEPGVGCWGCLQCGAEQAGAVAVLCDDCLEKSKGNPKAAILGSPAENRRIPIEQLSEAFGHDMSKHTEIQEDTEYFEYSPDPEDFGIVATLTAECEEGNHAECPDVEANVCDCNCHLSN